MFIFATSKSDEIVVRHIKTHKIMGNNGVDDCLYYCYGLCEHAIVPDSEVIEMAKEHGIDYNELYGLNITHVENWLARHWLRTSGTLEEGPAARERFINFVNDVVRKTALTYYDTWRPNMIKATIEAAGVTGEQLAKRMMFLAWRESKVIGMGIFQDRGPNMTEEQVWEHAMDAGDYPLRQGHEEGEVRADYVFGRMMKFHLNYDGDSVWTRHTKWTLDYNSFCGKFPDFTSLAKAAAEQLDAKITLEDDDAVTS